MKGAMRMRGQFLAMLLVLLITATCGASMTLGKTHAYAEEQTTCVNSPTQEKLNVLNEI